MRSARRAVAGTASGASRRLAGTHIGDTGPSVRELGREGGLAELESVGWRSLVDERWLRRYGWQWTVWTVAIVTAFLAPAGVLLWLSPWTLPAALICAAHAVGICELQARAGANVVRPAARRTRVAASADEVALGLLGDLVGHEARKLARASGLALQRGTLGVWLVGEGGALLVRPGGRRVDCWCVRVGDAADLPGPDRVAHLLLALREDEQGFATVGNLTFSGAAWRVRRRLPEPMRPALDVARRSRGDPNHALVKRT